MQSKAHEDVRSLNVKNRTRRFERKPLIRREVSTIDELCSLRTIG